jgi:DNA polymerase-1
MKSVRFVGGSSLLNEVPKATIDECVAYCKEKSVLGVDTETEGFDFTCKRLLMFQIGDKDRQYVIDVRDISIQPLKGILEDKNIIKIFHNAKFDYKFIKHWGGIQVENIYDTYLAERIIHCGKQDHGYSLSKCVERYCGDTLDKETRNKFVNLSGAPFTIDQITYGAKDVVYLLDIREAQQVQLHTYELEMVSKLENKVVKVFAEIEYEGLMIDETKWTKMAEDNVRLAREQELHLDKLVLEHPLLQAKYHVPIQADMFTPAEELRKTSINWSSPMQTLELFKLLVPKLEDVNGKKLSKHRYKHKLIDEYILYKERTKLANAYGTKFFNYINCDGRVHTNFSQILDTGRVSSSKPNMQQIPSDNTFRNCFVAPSGWVFVSSDYASQELNVIAYGSEDPVWLEALRRGDDLHGVCADLVFEQRWRDADPDLRKALRTQIKTINFGLAYGMGPFKLADTLNISKSEAEELINKYFSAFPNIKDFLERLGHYGKRNGYITTMPPFKRRRWFDSWYPKIWNDRTMMGELGSIERASKNTPIQGSSADMTKLALIYLYDEIQANWKGDVKIVMTVHDQIDTICKKERADEWATTMTALMEKAAVKIVKNGLLKADTNISETWEK